MPHITPYDPAREAELVALWRESFEFGVGIVDPHPLDEQRRYFREHVLPNHEVLLALEGPVLVGFVAATPQRIDQLHVRVGWHRRGVGTALLEAAKARSAGRLELYTFARNLVARAFYEHHGFVVQAFGFEPDWQLADVLYRWQAPGPVRPRWLVTGLGGTLGPRLAARARDAGADVIGWDRQAVPPDDTARAARFLDEARPDAIVHLAMGTPAWAGQLAACAAQRGLPMVFTSTAMVFDHEPDGPHGPADVRSARDDYGRMKCASEDAVLQAHPAATVLRIGWQIDGVGGGNHMVAALDRWQAEQGAVRASRLWRPACSFLDDTAAALVALVHAPRSGPVHFDSNAQEGHRFDEIVTALREAFGRTHWNVQVDDGYRHDQRLVGGAFAAPPLSSRLTALGRGLAGAFSAAANPAAPPTRGS